MIALWVNEFIKSEAPTFLLKKFGELSELSWQSAEGYVLRML